MIVKSLLAAIILFSVNAHAATIAQRLGYASDAKLVIVHADDIGMSHSVNQATFAAMATGSVNSGSMMVPCSWFAEAAAYYRAQPDLDLGLHLTLTSEWQDYKWRALSGESAAYSLHDAAGFMFPDVGPVAASARPEDVARELRAQVDAALAQGIRPTHLDSHMGTLFATPQFFQAYVQTGRRYRLPILVPREALQAQAPQLASLVDPHELLVDRIIMADPSVAAGEWQAYYTAVIENLQPGVTEIIVHAGYDNHELQAIARNHPDYGAAWRQRDTDFFADPKSRALLAAHDAIQVTWRELGQLVYPTDE